MYMYVYAIACLNVGIDKNKVWSKGGALPDRHMDVGGEVRGKTDITLHYNKKIY